MDVSCIILSCCGLPCDLGPKQGETRAATINVSLYRTDLICQTIGRPNVYKMPPTAENTSGVNSMLNIANSFLILTLLFSFILPIERGEWLIYVTLSQGIKNSYIKKGQLVGCIPETLSWNIQSSLVRIRCTLRQSFVWKWLKVWLNLYIGADLRQQIGHHITYFIVSNSGETAKVTLQLRKVRLPHKL